jgi:hypothetical protein
LPAPARLNKLFVYTPVTPPLLTGGDCIFLAIAKKMQSPPEESKTLLLGSGIYQIEAGLSSISVLAPLDIGIEIHIATLRQKTKKRR